MPEAHEQIEHVEHAGHIAGNNKRIALLIAVIALFLAFSETLGKSANTEAITLNIKASDTWNFFQAKTIRRGAVRGLVGIEGGVVSGVINLESPGVRAPGRRPRHDERYHEA